MSTTNNWAAEIAALKAEIEALKANRMRSVKAANKARSRPIELVHADGRIERFESGRAACTAYGLNQGTLSQVLRGSLRSTKGMKARYVV